MSDLSSDDSDYEHCQQLVLQCAVLVTYAAGTTALIYSVPLYNKTPYHTSALTGADWVCELLNGHPECIHNELGVHEHVFNGLIVALQQAGIHSSKHVFLEEQLAIFLYTCVMGLSLRHVSKWFQRANETTSQYILCFVQVDMQ